MQADLLQEPRHQAEICIACRYCEGHCAVSPVLHAERAFSVGDLTQPAILCHTCCICNHACQSTAPHECALTLPRALAARATPAGTPSPGPAGWPAPSTAPGSPSAVLAVLSFAALFGLARVLPADGAGFYAVMSHNLMVAIFLPAFLLPLLSLAVALRRYWVHVGGERVTLDHLRSAFGSAAKMRNLAGGHGDGCNFEDEDRFSHARRHAHAAVLTDFLLCCALTASGTILHCAFDAPAPYGVWSLPKLLGVPGGLLLGLGALWLGWLQVPRGARSRRARSLWRRHGVHRPASLRGAERPRPLRSSLCALRPAPCAKAPRCRSGWRCTSAGCWPSSCSRPSPRWRTASTVWRHWCATRRGRRGGSPPPSGRWETGIRAPAPRGNR
ncbi:tricarballylate utilization 4Fe-4S protein TcuB [Roseivivax sp. CAU 1761]